MYQQNGTYMKKYLTIRIDSDLLDEYQKMCNKSGYTQSKRVRALITADLELSNNNKNILNYEK